MKISCTHVNTENFQCHIVPVAQYDKQSTLLCDLPPKLQETTTALCQECSKLGQAGKVLLIMTDSQNALLFVGLGSDDTKYAQEIRQVMPKLWQQLAQADISSACCHLLMPLTGHKLQTAALQAFLSLHQADYKFINYKTKSGETQNHDCHICWYHPEFETDACSQLLATASAMAQGVKACKDLGNTPPNICNPSYLADYAQKLAEQHENLSVTVLEETDMQELGMGCFLSVTKGSHTPAKLVTLEYGQSTGAPVVLVGKGVTFDTGGHSLKAPSFMVGMKYDMCGAASVLGTIKALAELQAPVRVIGLLACTENTPGGAATRPDDVVTSMAGTTVEIANTDAEGRLVLCDTLTYAKKFEPKVVIDIATLTGACVVALGAHASGLYSNDEQLATQLLEAGNEVHDRAWQMPLWNDYTKQLDSPVADLCNMGGPKAGSVTAACFLQEFCHDYKWAHLDVAGTAFETGAKAHASGRPVSLLVQYILNNHC